MITTVLTACKFVCSTLQDIRPVKHTSIKKLIYRPSISVRFKWIWKLHDHALFINTLPNWRIQQVIGIPFELKRNWFKLESFPSSTPFKSCLSGSTFITNKTWQKLEQRMYLTLTIYDMVSCVPGELNKHGILKLQQVQSIGL